VTHLTCIKAATGERVWQQPRFGKSNLIAADGKLLLSTMAGEVVMVRATPAGFQELGRKQVLGATRQAPALAGGRLYLRDDKEIVCLEIKAPQSK
jgi:outer membrane protein assembly factor BamB